MYELLENNAKRSNVSGGRCIEIYCKKEIGNFVMAKTSVIFHGRSNILRIIQKNHGQLRLTMDHLDLHLKNDVL